MRLRIRPFGMNELKWLDGIFYYENGKEKFILVQYKKELQKEQQ